MRNLRLLATILFVAVLLVGIVLLLRQTNVQNDTSVTSTQVTTSQLASNNATDPPVGKLSKRKVSVSDIRRNAKSNTSNTSTSVVKKTKSSSNPNARLVPNNSKLNKKAKLNTSAKPRKLNGKLRATGNTSEINSEAQQIQKLEQMLREASNPGAKAKIQRKLNSLK